MDQDGSDDSEHESTIFSDEVEIIVQTKEGFKAKLVSIAEDEGEKIAIIEFENGEKKIRKIKCIFKETEEDVESDEVAVEVRTKSNRFARLLMQAEDEGEMVALIQYQDNMETKLTRQVSNGFERYRKNTGNLTENETHISDAQHSSMSVNRSRRCYSNTSISSFMGPSWNRRTSKKACGVGEIDCSKDAPLAPSRRTSTLPAQILLTGLAKTHWKCDNCSFSNLDSSIKCLMCRKPNKSTTHKQADARRILVCGRVGYNEIINGCYELVDDFFQGKLCYVHMENECCIYWSRTARRWIIDHRGMMNDRKACAVAAEDVTSPVLLTVPWMVFSQDSGALNGKWTEDPGLRIEIVDKHDYEEDDDPLDWL